MSVQTESIAWLVASKLNLSNNSRRGIQMMTRKACLIGCFLLFVLSIGRTVDGAILIPGLGIGDQYRIAFVSRDTTAAAETEISFYDSFVASQANLPGSLTANMANVNWLALGSTEGANADFHTGTNGMELVPIYLVDGVTRIADGYRDLWDLSLDSPLNRDQFGAIANVSVWTGSSATGVRRTDRFLGAPTLVTTGDSSVSNSFWMSDAATGAAPRNELRHVYGISNVLTVTAVPEPESFMTILSLLSLIVVLRPKIRSQPQA